VNLVTLTDNQTIQTLYEGAASVTSGATVTVTDQVGRKRQVQLDGLGRAVKVTEQDPATGSLTLVTNYGYDALDNFTSANQGGQTRTVVYDSLSRVKSQTTPEAGTVNFTYTDFNAVQTRTDARGVITTYGYDTLNRLHTISYNTASAPGVAATSGVTINYRTTTPGKGKLDSVVDGVGSESYAYDSLGKLSSKTRTIDSRSYQSQYLYNTTGQLTTLVYPSGKRVRMNHDGRGRMNGLDHVDSGGTLLSTYMSGITYNEASQVTALSLGNGTAESYTFSTDGRLQLASQSVTKGAATLLSLSYSYSASAGQMGTGTSAGNTGQIVSISGTVNGLSRNQAFSYDNVGRLLTASGWSSWGRRYGYDRWGNRTGMWDAVSGGTQIQSIAIAQTSSVANNRIANVNGVGYGYDASGGVTGDGGHSYTYDAEGRLVSVDAGASATNTYDANNWRLKKVSAGTTTHYVWEGGQVIAEYNGATGALISEYIYAGARRVVREQGGVLRYYHADRVSTRLITEEAE